MDKKLRNVLLFFSFSFVWTWLFYFAIVTFSLSPYEMPGMILLIIGGCSPSFVGIIMMFLTYNKEERMKFLKSSYQFNRIKWPWWIFIILLYPITMACAIGFDLLIGGSIPEMIQLKHIIANPLSIFFIFGLSFMSGPFAEEFGWRGFAQKPLLTKFGFTVSSIILGFVWAIWHLPLYFMQDTWHASMGFKFVGLPLFIISCVADTVIMAFVFIKTRGSILSAILIHWFSNLTGQLMSAYSNTVEITRVIIILILASFICIYVAKKKVFINKQVFLN